MISSASGTLNIEPGLSRSIQVGAFELGLLRSGRAIGQRLLVGQTDRVLSLKFFGRWRWSELLIQQRLLQFETFEAANSKRCAIVKSGLLLQLLS